MYCKLGRIYHNLKVRLEEDVQSRVKASVTTKLRPADSEASFEGELEDGNLYRNYKKSFKTN